jgi:hypothetical protein
VDEIGDVAEADAVHEVSRRAPDDEGERPLRQRRRARDRAPSAQEQGEDGQSEPGQEQVLVGQRRAGQDAEGHARVPAVDEAHEARHDLALLVQRHVPPHEHLGQLVRGHDGQGDQEVAAGDVDESLLHRGEPPV